MNTLHATEAADKSPIRAEHVWSLSSAELQSILADPNRWVRDAIAEHITGIPRASLRRLRHEGRGPRYVKVGSSVRYKVAWLQEFITERIVETSDSKPLEAA